MNECDWRIEKGGNLLCRHARVHAAGHVVTPSLCAICSSRTLPNPSPRKLEGEPRYTVEVPSISASTGADGPYLRALPCIHRTQEPSREVPCGICGAREERRNLYGCSLHGECFLRPVRLKGDYAIALPCAICDDRESDGAVD
jgi:hypothetical protein